MSVFCISHGNYFADQRLDEPNKIAGRDGAAQSCLHWRGRMFEFNDLKLMSRG